MKPEGPPVVDLSPSELERLIERAIAIRERAHAPYSGFRVGAAVQDEQGEIFVGCNVENASYSLTLCAERVASAAAVTAGRTRWRAIAVAAEGGAMPCGACRQFLAEFRPDLIVIAVDASRRTWAEHSLRELLPIAFGRDSLGEIPPRTE